MSEAEQTQPEKNCATCRHAYIKQDDSMTTQHGYVLCSEGDVWRYLSPQYPCRFEPPKWVVK